MTSDTHDAPPSATSTLSASQSRDHGGVNGSALTPSSSSPGRYTGSHQRRFTAPSVTLMARFAGSGAGAGSADGGVGSGRASLMDGTSPSASSGGGVGGGAGGAGAAAGNVTAALGNANWRTKPGTRLWLWGAVYKSAPSLPPSAQLGLESSSHSTPALPVAARRMRLETGASGASTASLSPRAGDSAGSGKRDKDKVRLWRGDELLYSRTVLSVLCCVMCVECVVC